MPDPMPHVVHYLPRIRLAEGGVVRAVVDLCDALAGAGCRVNLLTGDRGDLDQIWPRTPDSLEVTVLPDPVKPLAPLCDAAREAVSRTDALHLHTPWETGNLALARAARRTGTPFIVSVHGMLDDWCMSQRSLKKRMYLALAGRRLLERAAAVHTTAQAEWSQVKRWRPNARGVVTPLVFDLTEYTDLPGPEAARARWPALAEDSPAVLFLSRVHYKKGADVFIEAAGVLRERHVDAHFLIAGPGEEDYLHQMRELARERGVADRVSFLGMVGGIEKVSLYQAADVFVLPTSQENFGFVFFEALAAKTPVVTTRGVDTWPELESSGGAVITNRDAGEIASAVEKILADPTKRIQMGEAGRAWTLDRFAPGKVVREYVDLYARVARRDASA